VCVFLTKKGVKRKADTTTPTTLVIATPTLPSPAVSMAYKTPLGSALYPDIGYPASIGGNRRESCRQVKRPKKDFDDEQVANSYSNVCLTSFLSN